MDTKLKASKGKIIRDPIHGDIFFPNKFLNIIDTPEFQRLRRIHQLSVAYLVFPGAEHTRFSHSIGTYYIMQKIIEHFEPIMKSVNLELNERDVDLALAAALLHDIGHGPFSHAFEDAIPGSVDHEEWTARIITSKKSEINKKLKKNFDKKFPEELADIIRKERTVKKEGLRFESTDSIDLFFILSALISSQLDADRMDYLIRDAKYTGVAFGNIDIERLISSMEITVHKNNYYVCVVDKYLPDVENYLLARYHMHKEVYLHDVKCEMEIIIKKILERAVQIYHIEDNFGKVSVPEPLLKLFKGQEISIEEYTSLDDNIMLSTFSKWIDGDDLILSKLCSCIINREKYNKVRILNNTKDDIYGFKRELTNLFSKYDYDVDSYDNEYFWLQSTEKYNIYEKSKDNIWILKDDGTINDICDVSKIINEGLNGEKTMTFINYDILKEVDGISDKESAVDDIRDLVKVHDNRAHIEIEKKYIFEDFEVFNQVLEVLSKWNEYKIEYSEDSKRQIDYYYDTDDRYLFNENKTLRFREIDNKIQLTIKTPTKADNTLDNFNNQNERFEYETIVSCKNKDNNKQKIVKYLPELDNEERWKSLDKSLTIINDRRKMDLSKNDVKFEMVFDNVKYINKNGKEESDYQIEIELKSDYLHRINLKILSDYLEKNISELKPMNESKYKRGLRLTEQI